MRRQTMTVTASTDMVDSLGTILHEFAHAATPRRGDGGSPHGETWQQLYAAAVREVTGTEVVYATSNYKVMDYAVYQVMKAWWKRSGEEQIWRLASGGR